jgi:hypothetical protein
VFVVVVGVGFGSAARYCFAAAPATNVNSARTATIAARFESFWLGLLGAFGGELICGDMLLLLCTSSSAEPCGPWLDLWVQPIAGWIDE